MASQEKIFDNNFLLTYARREIELEYLKKINTSTLNYNKSITATLLLLSIITSILNFCYANDGDTMQFAIVRYVSYSNTLLNLIGFILLFILKETKYKRYILYSGYILFLFTAANFKYPLIVFVHNKTFVLMIIILLNEILFRLIYAVLSIFTFKNYLILNMIELVLIWAYLYPTSDPLITKVTVFFLCCYTFLFSYFTVYVYFLEKQLKSSFFFRYLYEEKFGLLDVLINNINTGILSIKDNKISYINNYLKIKLNSIQEEQEIQIDNKTEIEKIMKNFVKNINTSNLADEKVKKMINNYNQSVQKMSIGDSYLQKLSESISENFTNFTLIGETKIFIENTTFYYNIFLRYIKNSPQESFDFVFNDVTQTKLELQNKEFKYKTLFLSKVAHEFKNPIICMTELTNQLTDPSTEEEEKSKAISQIRSLSNFLLILIKDLNNFSELQLGKDISIEFKDCDIYEIVKFCEDVALGLMRKLNRPSVNLKVKIHENLRFFISDDWKLKQVLLNLLSNAIKFTFKGEILFEVCKDENSSGQIIVFKVKDEGIGIKEENKKKLFKPFSMETMSHNDMGSGLGLFIIKEISSKLGGNMEFDSTYGQGSTFIFTIPFIPVSQSKEDTKNINSNNFFKSSSKITIKNNVKEIGINPDSSVIINLRRQGDEELYKIKARKDSGSYFDSPEIKIKPVKKSKTYLRSYTINELINQKFEAIKSVEDINTVCMNIIVCDDETFIRQSAIRVLEKTAKEYKYKINLVEACDGVESVFIVYNFLLHGLQVNFILSDESMNFLTGSKSAYLIHEILTIKNMTLIPFYLITAYNNNFVELINKESVTKVLPKPLNYGHIQSILADLKIL